MYLFQLDFTHHDLSMSVVPCHRMKCLIPFSVAYTTLSTSLRISFVSTVLRFRSPPTRPFHSLQLSKEFEALDEDRDGFLTPEQYQRWLAKIEADLEQDEGGLVDVDELKEGKEHYNPWLRGLLLVRCLGVDACNPTNTLLGHVIPCLPRVTCAMTPALGNRIVVLVFTLPTSFVFLPDWLHIYYFSTTFILHHLRHFLLHQDPREATTTLSKALLQGPPQVLWNLLVSTFDCVIDRLWYRLTATARTLCLRSCSKVIP